MTTTHLDGATFGVEFECYLPDGASQQACAAAVSQRLGAPCIVETYNHQLRGHWKIVTDGSLGDYSRGIEIVSPVLNGEAGLSAVYAVAEALSDFGCTVSKKCGFHVHVGARNAPLTFFKSLVKFYGAFEKVIDAMMPVSRRANSNLYCRSMTSANANTVDRATSLDGVIAAYHGSANVNEARYYKLNLNAHRRHGTVEFRQHSATLSGTKSRNWVVLCLKMVDAAKRNPVAATTTARAVNKARPNSKMFLAGEMMMRPEGATRGQVCAAVGWPSVSMPAVAEACGLQFTTQRIGREVYYFAVVASAAPQTDVSIAGFANLIGATESERQYIEQRTNDLRGPVAWAA